MKSIFLILSLVISSYAVGQNFSYGKVSMEDFKIQSEDDSRVHDAILTLNKVSVNFTEGFQIISVHKRIRIETAAGLDYANQHVDLFQTTDNKEEIAILKGATYTLVDEEIVITELNEDPIFVEQIDNNYVSKHFLLPAVEVGSVIEIAYVIKSPFDSIENIPLQKEIPILNLSIVLQFPKFQSYYIETNPLSDFRIDFDSKSYKNQISILKVNEEDSKYFNQDASLQRLEVKNKTIALSKKNVPALWPESMSGDLNKYQARLIISLGDYNNTDFDEQSRSYISNWEELTKNIYKRGDFSKKMRSSRVYRKELETVINDFSDDKKKIIAVLSFLKSKVKWNGEYGIFTDEGLKNSIKKEEVNVAELNLLLIAMLKESGIDAYPVLVSAVEHDIPTFPAVNSFDYLIAQAVVKGNLFFLDATEEYYNINKIPQRAVNRKGRLIRSRRSSEWVNLVELKKYQEVTALDIELQDDFKVIGTGNKQIKSYSLLDTRLINADPSNKMVMDYLQKDVFGLDITAVEVEGLENLVKSPTFKFRISYINAFDKVEDKIIVKPLLYESRVYDLVELDTRKLPLELSQSNENVTVVNIKIPEGYSVESLPEGLRIIYNEGVGSYTFQISQINNVISTVATYDMNTSLITPEDYKVFRKFYKAVLNKSAEKIVLKKNIK